jgi:DNA-directed RNA polymerase specialized sigma24 family protein
MRQEELEPLYVLAVTETEATRHAQQLLRAASARRRAAVLALRNAGASYAEIAQRLDCSRSAVQSIVRASPASEDS